MLKGKSPLLVALALGVLAGVVAYSAIKKKEADVRAGWHLIPVIVAAQDLPEGTVVTFDMLKQRAVPDQFVTSSVVKPDSASYIVNQKVLVALQAGDPVLWSQFETTRTAERIASRLVPKMRAFTIETSGTSSVGGWVRPNDQVDVMGTFRDPQTNESVAVTVLQNVSVVATGKITGTTNVNLLPENQRDYNAVTLMVLPEEAEMLLLASEVGALALMLRAEGDPDLIERGGHTRLATLLSGERARQNEKIRQKITILRGGTRLAGSEE